MPDRTYIGSLEAREPHCCVKDRPLDRRNNGREGGGEPAGHESAHAQFMEAIITDSEVMADLVEDCLSHLLDDLLVV